MDDKIWQTKVAARLHDPIEKALVLLRDPAGHENGTSRALARLLGYHELPEAVDPDNEHALVRTVLAEKTGFGAQIPRAMYRCVQRADWWSAAADRPQWPMEEVQVPGKDGKTLAIVRQAQVRWTETPQIIHPLTGDALDLHWLEVSIQAAKKRAFDHFSALLVKLGAGQGAPIDWRRVLLTFWRFGPELDATGADTRDNERLGALWELLPADTRVPDHSIWEHLDLASAFAGAFCADARGEAALLAIALGPVQGFIAQARKLDDLWAGSHLLARLAWETMKPVAETLGPDAILFPKLRGLAQVDVWLREEMKLSSELFERCEWTRVDSDANPLFAAALPNRFVAIVPADRAQALAERCAAAARAWINELGQTVVRRLLEVAGLDDRPDCPAYAQMRAQLAGFPEIYWATVPFSLVRCRDEERQRDLDVSALLRAMAPFFGTEPDALCGFLDSPAWKTLGSDLEVRQGGRTTRFCAPNPGVLYPAVYDLVERLLAAAKSTRTFDRLEQGGWRESLAGEVEWLTHDRAQLALPPGERRKADTLWTRIAKRERRPAWAREGEHLGALAALKRLWPTLFAEEVSRVLGRPIDRYPVSTHTMALAAQLDVWLEKGGLTSGLDEAEKLLEQLEGEARPVALPRRLVIRHRAQEKSLKDARRIPALLDEASDADETNPSNAEAVRKIRAAVKCTLATAVDEDQRKSFRVETYYGLLFLDGDRMGAILSGDPQTAISYRGSLHPEVRKGFDELAAGNSGLTEYGRQARAVSPARHMAISAALNDFSQFVARHVVEEEYRGRLIYSGGDDVLAVLPVADLLGCAQRLRHAYSGVLPEHAAKDWRDIKKDRERLYCKNGYAWLRGRLMRMMGSRATASAGVVVAHHQAPLAMVLRELRETEQAAKHEGERDAVAVRVIKRSGGAAGIVLKWADLPLLQETVEYLRHPDTSRRAVYHSLAWLRDLPDPRDHASMCQSLLAYQFERQSKHPGARSLAGKLVEWAAARGDARQRLCNLLQTAEFLAREVRAPEAGDALAPSSTRRTEVAA